jgi:hypothetical protein
MSNKIGNQILPFPIHPVGPEPIEPPIDPVGESPLQELEEALQDFEGAGKAQQSGDSLRAIELEIAGLCELADAFDGGEIGGLPGGPPQPLPYEMSAANVVSATYTPSVLLKGPFGTPNNVPPNLSIGLDLPAGVNAWGTTAVQGDALVVRLTGSETGAGPTGPSQFRSVRLPIPVGMPGPRKVIVEDVQGKVLTTIPLSTPQF